MKHLACAAAAALALAGGNACAAEYDFAVNAYGTYFYYEGGCLDGNGGWTPICNATLTGHLQIITTDGDGVKTGADLESISFDSNIVPAFTYHAGDQQTEFYGVNGAVRLIGMTPGASVTVQGSGVSLIDFLWEYPAAYMYGGTTSLETMGGYSEKNSDGWQFFASLTPVPEPAEGLLLAAALAGFALRRRR